MEIHILTIFPEVFNSFLSTSLIAKARERNLVNFTVTDIREFADPPHFKVDDPPYGGGAGMVLMPEPLARAIEAAKKRLPKAKVLLLSASGTTFSQPKAAELSKEEALILVCGRYEGVDQRVIDLLVNEEISLGDYLLMGGEVASMAIIEATTRLIPGVLGNETSAITESFSATPSGKTLLEAPQYTRPADFRGIKVPPVLLSGDHSKIDAWRNETAISVTKIKRPDLLKSS